MKKKFGIYGFITFSLLLTHSAMAQQNSITINFNYGTPSSSGMRDFLDDDSWVGWSMDYQRFLNPKFSIGLTAGYQGFDEKRARDTYVIGNTSINAVTWRDFHTVPLLATAKYYFTETGFRPYVGVGIGGAWNKQILDYGSYRESETTKSLNTTGEAGVSIVLRSDLSVKINARYNHGFYDPDDFEMLNYGYWNVGIGLAYRL